VFFSITKVAFVMQKCKKKKDADNSVVLFWQFYNNYRVGYTVSVASLPDGIKTQVTMIPQFIQCFCRLEPCITCCCRCYYPMQLGVFCEAKLNFYATCCRHIVASDETATSNVEVRQGGAENVCHETVSSASLRLSTTRCYPK